MPPFDETTYDRIRFGQWLAGKADGRGLSRRHLLQLGAATAAAMAGAAALPAPAAGAAGPIVKPLPPELFYLHGTNAEMRWEAMAGQGYLTPADRFFVRNHTSTPTIDMDSWRLELFGSGLNNQPVSFTYRQLRRLPEHNL